MINVGQSLAIIAVTAAVTALIRFLPFLIFHKGTPKPILYLGEVLPFAVMGMLVVYCLKNTSFISAPYGAPPGGRLGTGSRRAAAAGLPACRTGAGPLPVHRGG